METVTDFEKWIDTMSSELGQQVIGVKRLAVAFTDGDILLIRYDQVARLRILKTRIMEEVENIEQMESAAQRGADKGALLGGGIAFTLGSLFMAAKGHQNAFDIGAKMAGSVLSRKVPFGTVLIGIGKEGIPEDVRAIPVSQLARESKISESEIETNLKHGGYLLMTPQVFTQALDRVERDIFDGSLSLPILISEITKRITR